MRCQRSRCSSFSFLIFNFSLPWPLFFLSNFFYLPLPSNPEDLVLSVCLRTFYLPLFSFFRGRPRVRYQISYPNPFGISPTNAYEYLGLSYYFLKLLPNMMKIHKFIYTIWGGLRGYSRLFPRNSALVINKSCAFIYSQFNFSNTKKQNCKNLSIWWRLCTRCLVVCCPD